MQKNKILVATMNWGLGHSARCIPIIKQLQQNDFEPIIASDGAAGKLLQKEFPHLKFVELPSYNIEYSKDGRSLKWKLLRNLPGILGSIDAENQLTRELVEEHELCGIISDNRFGVRSSKLRKNVFITHQINVLSGKTSFLTSFIHQNYIRKFDQCWVPDLKEEPNLSGRLGHSKKAITNLKYIGPQSRFCKKKVEFQYKYLVLLSGPEPQRSILEEKLLEELQKSKEKILFVRGVISEREEINSGNPNILIKNYLFGSALKEVMNSSEIIISRSGYSTIMDLAKLEKKAFFIPTPGQHEQEYLAKRMETLKLAPFCKQENFQISELERLDHYSGLRSVGSSVCFRDLFDFFKCE